MNEIAILITGANGEIGHSLLKELGSKGIRLVGLDINPLDADLSGYLEEFILGDINDVSILEQIFEKYQISKVYHLAALLSTAAEKNPDKAHYVNVNGTFNILNTANKYVDIYQQNIQFIFPSTIAVYGVLPEKDGQNNEAIKENQFLNPITIYGVNKLYCEMLGTYFSTHYKLLDEERKFKLDFRCVRFPGIISASTMPTGGTSDYAPEMIHSAAKGEGYESFVSPEAIIPFMVMPDAVKALIMLADAPKEKLSKNVYNVAAFSATAQQLADVINQTFPNSAISYAPDPHRQRIVDSWPAMVDDSAARKEWGWTHDYDLQRGFSEYLIPQIKEKYST